LFARPIGLSDRQLTRVLEEEGWVLGTR
jgi:hypothetical protein